MRRLGTTLALLLAIAFAVASGCSRSSSSAPASTARVLTPAQVWAAVPGAACGDVAYAEVNSAWLHEYYDTFRAEIFRQGVVKWDERFDCNHFAGYYVELAQTKFYLANFQSRTKAQTLALGAFWFRPHATGTAADFSLPGHAIVAALTERGLIFIEPQTGGELVLTPAERASAFLEAF